ncbi:hypothetical protein GCM10009730_64530 [Streptomyces albidochromogenes]
MESPGRKLLCVNGSEATEGSRVSRAKSTAKTTVPAKARSMAAARPHLDSGGLPGVLRLSGSVRAAS